MKAKALKFMALLSASVFSQYIVYGDDGIPARTSDDVPAIYTELPPQVKIDLAKCNLEIATNQVFMDVETTGLSKERSKIIEIVIFTHDGIFSTLVNPQCRISPKITEITGIGDKDVENAPIFPQIAEQVYSILEGKTIIGHNVAFDINVVKAELHRASVELGETKSICTLKTERKFHGRKGNTLAECLERHNIKLEGFHRAGVDVEGTVRLYQSQVEKGYYKDNAKSQKPREADKKPGAKKPRKSRRSADKQDAAATATAEPAVEADADPAPTLVKPAEEK